MAEHTEGTEFFSRRGCSRFLMIVTIILFGGIFALYFWVDSSCVSGADDWLNDYPGAIFISQEHSFLRPFGIGETARILYEARPIDAVEEWYVAEDIERDRRGMNRGDGAAWMRWYLQEAEDGGTIIILQSDCAKRWVLWE